MSPRSSKPQKAGDPFFRNREICEQLLDMFSLFSNGIRFKILCVLREGDRCVKEITEIVGGKHSNISQQLKMLALAGYVTREREDKMIIYHLSDERVIKIIDFLRDQFGPH